MRQADAPAGARIQAIAILLDRGWGKPTQPHTGEDDNDIRITIRQIVEGGDKIDPDLPFNGWRQPPDRRRHIDSTAIPQPVPTGECLALHQSGIRTRNTAGKATAVSNTRESGPIRPGGAPFFWLLRI